MDFHNLRGQIGYFCLFLTNYCPLESNISRKQVKMHIDILDFIIYDLDNQSGCLSTEAFGMEGKIGKIIFDHILALEDNCTPLNRPKYVLIYQFLSNL